MKKKNCFTRLLCALVVVCMMAPAFTVFSTAGIEDSAFPLRYHSTLYYDASNPYNNVYGNDRYAYRCYVSDETALLGLGVVFEKDGIPVTDEKTNANLAKMYFAQNSQSIIGYQNALNIANAIIEVSDARKINALIDDITSAASKSLGSLTAVYLTGGTASATAIAQKIAEQTLDTLASHFTDITTIISEAQLNLFYIYSSELENIKSGLSSATNLSNFEACERFVAKTERLERINSFLTKLIPAVTEGLSSNFWVNLGRYVEDATSGFVGEFGKWVGTPSEIEKLRKNNPTVIAKAVLLAKSIKDASDIMSLETLEDIEEMYDDSLSTLFCVIDAYRAYKTQTTTAALCYIIHQRVLETVVDKDADSLPNTTTAVLPDGLYTFENAASSLMMNVYDGINADETNVVTWSADGTTDQIFYLKHVGNGKYVIFVVCSKNKDGSYTRCIDVYTGGTNIKPAAGDNVDIYTRASKWDNCQLFYLVELNNGAYAIENCAVQNLVIGASAPDKNNGNVAMEIWSNQLSQMWYLNKTTIDEGATDETTKECTTPDLSSAGYSSINPFVASGYGGQCTSFVYGRAYEKLGIKLPNKTYKATGSDGLTAGKTYNSFRNNARTWWYINKALNLYPYGDTPAANSIAVWDGAGTGHVAFVEKVSGDTVYFNEANFSNFKNTNYGGGWDGKLHSLSTSSMKSRGSSFKLLGYIYLDHPAYTLSIQYHVNGGEVESSQYYVQDSMIYTTKYSEVHQQNLTYGILKGNGLYNAATFGLKREGYTFLGWQLALEEGVIWDQDAAFYPEDLCPDLKNGNKTIVVYANWQKNECQHTPVTQTYSATCLQAGYTITTCAECSLEISRTTIPPTGHSYESVVTEPNCTEQGYTTYTCHCGDSYVSDYTDATGHQWTEWYDITPCKEERFCTTCGETESRDKIPNYDVDGNGIVDQADVALLMNILVGNFATDVLHDMDFDGVLTIYDCVLLMQQLN